MGYSRAIRACAIQALYQFDSGNAASPDIVRESLKGSPGDEATHEEGFQLATLAWEFRAEADAAVAGLTPEWPTHRQPVVDRNILRLAHYEMTRAEIPPKVAINEAVELAREFSTDKSPAFVNGVLDKLYRLLKGEDVSETAAEELPEISASDPGDAHAASGAADGAES